MYVKKYVDVYCKECFTMHTIPKKISKDTKTLLVYGYCKRCWDKKTKEG